MNSSECCKGGDVLVSIQCFVYNHEKFLRQCLEGFVMQKTNFKFEAIVHDDVSTDGSVDIIKEYAHNYPNIIKPIFEEENQYSKHDGSLDRIVDKACSGKYIAYCEGDDYWIDPFKLQKQVDYLETHPDCIMCFHNAIVIFSDTDAPSYIFNKLSSSRNVELKELLEAWIVPTASMMFRREIRDNFPEWSKQIYSSDLTTSLVCFSKGKVYSMKDVMSCYRKTYHTTSSTSQFESKALFVHQQHINLLRYYNVYTEGKYDVVLNQFIKEKEQIIKYAKLRKKSFILAQIAMPRFFLKRLKEKIS